MLTDKKIKLIQEFQAQMTALQLNVQMGEVKDNSKVAAAYSAMLLGVNEEDIAAFSRQFPETPIGPSGVRTPPAESKESKRTTLTDAKSKAIKEFAETLYQAEPIEIKDREFQPNEKVAAAYSAIIRAGVNDQDIEAFNHEFPTLNIRISIGGADQETPYIHPGIVHSLQQERILENKLRQIDILPAFIQLYLNAPDLMSTLQLTLMSKQLSPDLDAVVRKVVNKAQYRG
jgi:hypothetical protein